MPWAAHEAIADAVRRHTVQIAKPHWRIVTTAEPGVACIEAMQQRGVNKVEFGIANIVTPQKWPEGFTIYREMTEIPRVYRELCWILANINGKQIALKRIQEGLEKMQ